MKKESKGGDVRWKRVGKESMLGGEKRKNEKTNEDNIWGTARGCHLHGERCTHGSTAFAVHD